MSQDACKTTDDCSKGTCCINSNIFISSKRQTLFPIFLLESGGTCQPYTKEGQDCFAINFNSCGCEPGIHL